MTATDLDYDKYSFYDFKPKFAASTRVVPAWVGDHARRLKAYALLTAYLKNKARSWLPDDPNVDKKDRREYGDAATLVEQIYSSLIGDDQSLVTPDAELPEDEREEAAVAQHELILAWMEQENFLLKMLQTEWNACSLGDGTYVLGWDDKRKRPRLRVYEPDAYFPVLRDEDEGYPKKVHVAYEFEEKDESTGVVHKWLRKMTWSLEPVEPGDGSTKILPWNDSPHEETCWYEKGIWDVTQGGVDVNALTPKAKGFKWEVEPKNLDQDYIPVLHIPNTPSETEHYGDSSLALVMQLLDDIVSTDTDLQASSATTGTPPIAVAGASLPKDEEGKIASYGPGTVWETGDGTATMIDTSSSLDALLKLQDANLKRLSVNSKVPESLLGRVKPNEVPSGITITLSFTPHSGMIKRMRMVRDPKYRLLFRFVCRMYMQDGQLDDIYPCYLRFGSFLPSDKKETVDLIRQLLTGDRPAISLATAVRMLVEAGFPIEDAAAEVEAILLEDFASAQALLDATGDVNAVRERLNMPPVTLAPAAPPSPGPGPGEDEDEL